MLSKTAVKYIQSLTHKKFRDENGIFLAEGPKVVEEIISSGNCICKDVYGLQDYFDSNKDFFQKNKINFICITEIELEKISLLKKPNKVLGLFYKLKTITNSNYKEGITLILDEISDPGNMGTIIRIADWFDIKNIICSLKCVDVYNPKVIQSSMASIARINIVYSDLISFIEQHTAIPLFAATLDGNHFNEITEQKNCFVMIGNEANGIHDDLLQKATQKISIPRFGKAESLNAAVATGIILSSIKNK